MSCRLWCLSIVGLITLTILSGCADEELLDTKRKFAIEQLNQTYLKSTNAVPKRWGKDILVAVESATVKTLKIPKCASAVLSRTQSGTYMFYVFWIEANPSVDSLELYCGAKQSSVFLPLSDVDKRENRRASESTIVLGSSYKWIQNTHMAQLFDGMASSDRVKVRLWQQGASIGDWFPVCRLDTVASDTTVTTVSVTPCE